MKLRESTRTILAVGAVALASAGAPGRAAGAEAVAEGSTRLVELAASVALHAAYCSAHGWTDAGRVLRGAVLCSLHSPLTSLAPAGCWTTRRSGNVVTLSLDNCTGPAGARHVTGTLTAAVTSDTAGTHVEASGTGVAIETVIVDLDETVTYQPQSSGESIAVSHVSSGFDGSGNAIRDTSDYTLVRAHGCKALAGMWDAQRGSHDVSTTASGFEQCSTFCPAAGVVTEVRPAGEAITVTYDGSDVARFTTSGGESGTIYMVCTPGG